MSCMASPAARTGPTHPGQLNRDAAGNLYGLTGSGGSGAGVVFRVDQAGHEKVLYTFTGGADGGYGGCCGFGRLIWDSAGNLYGTTSGGGAGSGVVFKLDPTGNETVLYTFTGGADGAYPAGRAPQ